MCQRNNTVNNNPPVGTVSSVDHVYTAHMISHRFHSVRTSGGSSSAAWIASQDSLLEGATSIPEGLW